MQANIKDNVRDTIATGLRAFFDLAQLKLRRGTDFKKMTRAQQLQAGRALFTLRDIAAAPDKYFSRTATQGSWHARAVAYAASHGMAPQFAYYIVQTPADIVRDKAGAAFWSDYKLRARFENFCTYVKDWYYDSTSAAPERQLAATRDAEKIIAMAKSVCDEHSITKNGRVVHYVNGVLASLKQTKR